MIAGLLITTIYCTLIWLVFFKMRWLRFTIGWAVVSTIIGLHLVLIFLIGLRFTAPNSYEAVVVQHTIQIVPRLSEPTLLTEVLVRDNVPVKKGQPLFRFDRRLYQDKVNQLEAELAAAKQNAAVLKVRIDQRQAEVSSAKAKLQIAQFQESAFNRLQSQGFGRTEQAVNWRAQTQQAEAAVNDAVESLAIANLNYESQVDGVNTTVMSTKAQLDQAQYYLDNTTIFSPADGRIINLQALPGMIVGILRVGAIAGLITDEDRYLLASFRQENLKYIKNGQPTEVALDLYPGQIFKGTVEDIWWGTGRGQYLPTADLPDFSQIGSRESEGLFAVKIRIDDMDSARFPIGAQGTAAVYTGNAGFAALRRITIRAYSWLNWLYPL